MTTGLEVLQHPERAATLLHPERRRLLEALRELPDSASGLARRLDDTRQRLNYHLRALEEAGLVEVAEVRKRGNFRERVMRPVARRFVVDPTVARELSEESDPEPARAADRFSATYLIALAARAIRELADLRERARRDRKRLATAAIETRVRLARPADFEPFARDLSAAVAEVVASYHTEADAGRPFRVVLGAYPASEFEPSAGREERPGREKGEGR